MNRLYVIHRRKQLNSNKKINAWLESNDYIIQQLVMVIETFLVDNQFTMNPNIINSIQQFIINNSI